MNSVFVIAEAKVIRGCLTDQAQRHTSVARAVPEGGKVAVVGSTDRDADACSLERMVELSRWRGVSAHALEFRPGACAGKVRV